MKNHPPLFQRRQFLQWTGLAASGLWYPALVTASEWRRPAANDEIAADVLIVGGGLGGCAAALAATRAGATVVMTEPTDWIGGQMTQQAVPPDENGWIESFGCTQSYHELRQRIREYYRQHYPLTDVAKANKYLKPGGPGSCSPLAHEPKVSLAVLQEMLAPAVKTGHLTVLLNTSPERADVDGDRVRAVCVFNRNENRHVDVKAKYFIDASETGELLPLTGTEFVTGSESQAETGEPHASPKARPGNMQAVTWCYAIDYLEGEDHTIDKPAQYDFWRHYRPETTPPWPANPYFFWGYANPNQVPTYCFIPNPGARKTPRLNLWLYRRILDIRNFRPGSYRSDITIVNWPQNDYLLGNVFGGTPEENARHLEGARQLSLSLLYWAQTEAPRDDGKVGWPGLRLRKDIVDTADGLAKYPYIRESRRIKAEFTILEQRLLQTVKSGRHKVVSPFPDSVGIGSYSMDLHGTTEGDMTFGVHCSPFQIPLGSLIPKRMENLVAGCKNIGATHITNGAYRLHPIEWNIGESAGALAAFCLECKEPPRHVRRKDDLLQEFQTRLGKQGVNLDWSKLAGCDLKL